MLTAARCTGAALCRGQKIESGNDQDGMVEGHLEVVALATKPTVTDGGCSRSLRQFLPVNQPDPTGSKGARSSRSDHYIGRKTLAVGGAHHME